MLKRLSVLVLAVMLAAPAMADRRLMVWTYGYQTMPAGDSELEHYFGYKLPDNRRRDEGQFSHQIEIELGLTDRWDISIYQMFSQENDSGFKYDGFKLRTRYRLFESGQYPVDPLLYFEMKRPAGNTDPTVLEGKLILARDFENIFTAFNFVVERNLGSGHETEWKYDIGFGYQAAPFLAFALESKGNFESGAKGKRGLGPTASFAKGSLWFSAGVLFGISVAASDFEFRYILGIHL